LSVRVPCVLAWDPFHVGGKYRLGLAYDSRNTADPETLSTQFLDVTGRADAEADVYPASELPVVSIAEL